MSSSARRLCIGFVTVLVAVGVGTSASVASPRSLRADVGSKAAAAALTQLGKPYVWGKESPSTGFDASGLVAWAFARAGVPNLPHYPLALWQLGCHVVRTQLRVGDLVFFDGHQHVGIYVGRSRFVHAPHTGDVVRVQSLSSGFYGRHYDGAVRVTASG
jgi:peptidoglycan DL-endopeptidase CwlO